MKWPGKAWVDSHPLQSAEIFGAIMFVAVAGYLFGAGYVLVHFITKYW